MCRGVLGSEVNGFHSAAFAVGCVVSRTVILFFLVRDLMTYVSELV